MSCCSDDFLSSDVDSDFENALITQHCQDKCFQMCQDCNMVIFDKCYLTVDSKPWHISCLKCTVCCAYLQDHTSCFIKDGEIYCKADYEEFFGVKCAKCSLRIQSSDWIRRANKNIYHLACFVCYKCKRQLTTGDEFGLCEDKLLCKSHYFHYFERGCSLQEEDKPKAKRYRTAFRDDQVEIMQANFEINANPDAPCLEVIAIAAELEKRVVQVWFQNARAKQRRQR